MASESGFLEDVSSFFYEHLQVLWENFDLWFLIGLIGSLCYFGRLVVQWWQSERAGKPVIPGSYWTLSVIGATVLLIYAMGRKDPIFILNYLVPFSIYLRQLILHKRNLVPVDAAPAVCPKCGELLAAEEDEDKAS